MGREIFLQDLHQRIPTNLQLIEHLLVAEGKLFMATSEGSIREALYQPRDLLRLRLFSCYEQCKAKNEGLVARLLSSSVREAITTISKEVRISSRQMRKLDCFAGFVLGLLQYRLGGLLSRDEQCCQILVYSCEQQLQFIGSLNDKILSEGLHRSRTVNVPDPRIRGFEVVRSPGPFRLLLLTQRLYQITVVINAGAQQPLQIKVQHVLQPVRLARVSEPGSFNTVGLPPDFASQEQLQESAWLFGDLLLTSANHEHKTNTAALYTHSTSRARRQLDLFSRSERTQERFVILGPNSYEAPLRELLLLDAEGAQFRQLPQFQSPLVRELSCPPMQIIGFSENGQSFSIKLREIDLLVGALLAPPSSSTKAEPPLNAFVEYHGPVQTCVLLLHVMCTSQAQYWVEEQPSPNSLSHKPSLRKYERSKELASKAAAQLGPVGSKLVQSGGVLCPAKLLATQTYLARLLLPLWERPLLVQRDGSLQVSLGLVAAQQVRSQIARLADLIGQNLSLPSKEVEGEKQGKFIEEAGIGFHGPRRQDKPISVLQQKQRLKKVELSSRSLLQALDAHTLIFDQALVEILAAPKHSPLLTVLREQRLKSLYFGDKLLLAKVLVVRAGDEYLQLGRRFPGLFEEQTLRLQHAFQHIEAEQKAANFKLFFEEVRLPVPAWVIDRLRAHPQHCLPFFLECYFTGQDSLRNAVLPTLLAEGERVRELLRDCSLPQAVQLLKLVVTPQDLRFQIVCNLKAKLIARVQQRLPGFKPKALAALRGFLRSQADLLNQLKQRGQALEPFMQQNQIYQTNFLGVGGQTSRLTCSHMISRIVKRCERESRLEDCNLWPLPLQASLQTLFGALPRDELLFYIQQTLQINIGHENYKEFRGEVQERVCSQVFLQEQGDCISHPHWVGAFLLERGTARTECLSLLLELFRAEMGRPQYSDRKLYIIMEVLFFLSYVVGEKTAAGKMPQEVLRFRVSARAEVAGFMQRSLQELQGRAREDELCRQVICRAQELHMRFEGLAQN